MSSQNSVHELSCPNCGAPYTLPATGNQVVCAHCGSHFVVPESVRPAFTPIQTFSQPIAIDTTDYDPAQVRRWIRWIVIFVIVTTVVPIVCGVGASLCGLLGPIIAMFVGR